MSIEQLRRHPGYLVLQLSKQARRIGAEVSTDGLRAPHVSVLALLAESGPCSQKEISDALRIDASDLVTLLDDLERADLASRHRDARDRRRYAVEVTGPGRTLLRERLDVAEEIDDRLFGGLTAAERRQLAELLLKAYAHHEVRR
ncbi:MarR family winged helix-turn-helix transcriptional regulator [Umezawaea tangerina]|uniref:DNA-binding MarR family transcriptional regulator n=1 Tax=Umezawaea tangerina TaxID=84725 RepID=A0A2T0SL18_9PSEU|nr:MarR family transcriptional regulator [Umezawaea tangerina]PRY34108.1 DNA-binding MarR family transcriptional regulator [Umezawaea tangerina]